MIKKSQIVLIAIIVCISTTIIAQVGEGVIHYEFRMDLHRNIPPEREEMKAMIPQYRTNNYILLFNSNERLYKLVEEETAPHGQGGRGGQFRFRTPRIEAYVNTTEQEHLIFQEFFGTTYLIIDELKLVPWQLGNEYMDIAGYRCQMAWYNDTIANEEFTAWFTVGIQPFIGPDRYTTLPGTILALDINNGERVWVARKVEKRTIKEGELRKPTRGEKITREEYDKKVEEQMERMRQRGGGFGF